MATTIAARVYVDWDADGSFATDGDEITAYVKTASWQLGIWDRFDNVARAGSCSVVLDNSDRRFSIDNVYSPYYGKFKPNLPLRIDATDGITAWTVFRGVVTGFVVENGDRGRRETTIEGEDYVGLLSRTNVALPIRSSLTSDEAIRLITSAAFRSGVATGTITLDAVPNNGETVTIGDVTYTFTTGALDSAYKVKIGTTPSATGLNLAACINAAQVSTQQGYEASVVYGNAGITTRHPDVTAAAELLDGAAGGTTTIAPVAGLGAAFVGKMPGGVFRSEAQSFKATAGTLSQITVTFAAGEAGDPGDMVWEICANSGGVPGSVLQTGTFTPVSDSVNTINVADGINLAADTLYWLVLHLETVPASEAYWRIVYGNDVYADGYSAIRDNYDPWIPVTAYDDACTITTGSISGANVYIKAVAHGAWGNAIALEEAGAAITLSDATLTGGVDGPAGLLSTETGSITLDEVGATWSEDDTSALAAIADVVASEGQALFYGDNDGTLTYKNRHWQALQTRESADLILDGEFTRGEASMALDDIINRAIVRYTPVTTRASGVVAKADSVIEVPGTSLRVTDSGKIERYNLTDDIPDPENTAFVKLAFVDTETGEPVGAEDLVLPLVAGTDFSINDRADGTGFNYTTHGLVRFEPAPTGTGIEVSMQNSALGQLYISGLQVRGVLKIGYDPVDVLADNRTSITAYGLRPKQVELPLNFTGVDTFAPQLAAFLINRNAEPSSRQETVGFQGRSEAGAVNLFSLGPGDIVTVSEAQTGISARRSWITGVSGAIAQGNQCSLLWHLRRLDDIAYLILDDATYGRLDNNRLGL